MTQEIKDRIEQVKEELDELYAQGMDGAEALHEEVEVRIAELKAEYEKLRGELFRTVDDAKGFFERNQVAVIIVGSLLALGAIALLIL